MFFARPRGMMAQVGGPAAAHVTSNVALGSATSHPVSFSGASSGDYAFIKVPNCLNTASISGGAGGWARDNLAWTNYGFLASVFRKVLAAGDMAGVDLVGIGESIPPVVTAIYRGASVATLKSTNAGQTSTGLSLTGLTKNGACKGLVSFWGDGDAGSSPTAPAGWNDRGRNGFYKAAGAGDLLVPANYVNGSAVAWSGFVAGSDQVGFLYELT